MCAGRYHRGSVLFSHSLATSLQGPIFGFRQLSTMLCEACVSSAGPQTGEGMIERESSHVSLQAQGELKATFL